MFNHETFDDLTDFRQVIIEQPDDDEALITETTVTQQRPCQIPNTDEHSFPVAMNFSVRRMAVADRAIVTEHRAGRGAPVRRYHAGPGPHQRPRTRPNSSLEMVPPLAIEPRHRRY